jgi:peptidoglycan/xylan/chitin deacetylase (PgdA/CDA1 family)
MYHDVVEPERDDESGFAAADANIYKLETPQFAAHLRAIAALQTAPPVVAPDLLGATTTSQTAHWLLTFDDGGASAQTHVAEMLEHYGWRGHFFVTTDYINTKGFLTPAQIRDLHARGHIIGSHSCSHPLRMSHCSPAEMLREWRESLQGLSDMIGAEVNTASVPGGYYSRDVASAAARAGCKVLFTSEPVTRISEVDGCLILGRYSIHRQTAPQMVAGLVAGQLAPGLRQALLWNAKKLAKRIGGAQYIKLKKSLINRRAGKDVERQSK